MKNIYVATQPEMHLRNGIVASLPALLSARGSTAVAIVTGGRSIRGKEAWAELTDTLLEKNISFLDFTVRGEPTPETVDHFTDEVLRDLPLCDHVVAIGGGSVMDAAKALAAALGMCRSSGGDAAQRRSSSIADYLEGVGESVPDGRTLPLIAVPTTAGTGSEATKNAVLCNTGPGGYKKSLRHDNYVPAAALIDPELHVGTPAEITRASGLDAVTQLMEVYLSTVGNTLTDTLALKGLSLAGEVFPRLLSGEDSTELRAGMALAAYLSGVGLASVGLGVVHGIASPVGAMKDIPHGVVCGLTVAPSVRITVASRHSGSGQVVERYGHIAEALGAGGGPGSVEALIALLETWAAPLPRLDSFGFTESDITVVAPKCGMKNHPVTLSTEEITKILEAVLS